LEIDTEKAEMAATDPEYGFNMTVDGINYMEKTNLNCQNWILKRDDQRCFRGDNPLIRLGLPALAATCLL
jgi:hypothetical protein